MREVRMALLEADVALPVVKTFVSRVKERARAGCAGSLTPGQAGDRGGVRRTEKADGEQNDALNLAAVPPAGCTDGRPAGAGKTTTTGKLAKFLKSSRKK